MARQMNDPKKIWVDGNRLHKLLKTKKALTPNQIDEVSKMLTQMSTRQCAHFGADESLIPLIVEHCFYVRQTFDSSKAQAFTYFTSVICNFIGQATGKSVSDFLAH